jgi:hypothetical protein
VYKTLGHANNVLASAIVKGVPIGGEWPELGRTTASLI